MRLNNKLLWGIWLLLTMLFSGYFAYSMTSEDQSLFLPGKTSHGHYQIEIKCETCHGESFGGKEALQNACVKCHGKELKIADDKHPKAKFTDPRNADRTAILDARYCITCHVEHKPEITREMGVTVAQDVCYLCHADIAEDRKSHAGMAFDTCDSSGCHNFHDNRALYEDFLAKHLDEPRTFNIASVTAKSTAKDIVQQSNYPAGKYPLRALSAAELDAPKTHSKEQKVIQDWHQTAHAKAGVNCSGCHVEENGQPGNSRWVEKPNHTACKQCHGTQVDGFLAGRHGMRLAQNLSPMTPALARQSMKTQSVNKTLGCTSCHNDHQFDVRHAAVDACLSCHNDEHSLAYKKSRHYKLWLNEAAGGAAQNKGVSCATCHLPREKHKTGELHLVSTQHNQNDNLRPNEKMLRSVCMNCHGLAFAIDALADEQLIARNFNGNPSRHIASIDMTRERIKQKQHKKPMTN